MRCLGAAVPTPAERVDYVQPSIAVNVADTDPMSGSVTRLGHRVDDPGCGGFVGIGFRVAHVALRHVDDFRSAVAIDIAHRSDFGLVCRNHIELVPPPFLSPRIHVEVHAKIGRGVVRVDDIGPSIARGGWTLSEPPAAPNLSS